ncbi:MAG: adenylate/guanylate cyclase domain-containing protein [Planctomycetota bacterium]
MADKNQEEQWRRADDEVRKNLPPGVKLVRTLRGHTDWIGRIAWSPDGRLIASPSMDMSIRLWDAENGKETRRFEGHQHGVNSVVFSPDGARLASGSYDNTVCLWDVGTGEELRRFKGYEHSVNGVVFSPDGARLASGSDDNTVRVWDVGTGKEFRRFGGHQGWVSSVVFSPDGARLTSGGGDNTVRLWDVRTGKKLRRFEGHQEWVPSVVFSPDGARLASGSDDNTVRLWDVGTGKLLRTLEGHTDSVICVAFLSDGRLLASKSSDHTVRLWSVDPGACVAVIPEPTSRYLWPPGLAFNPRLPRLATVGSDPGAPADNPGSTETLRDCVIHIWQLDLAVLLGQVAEPSAHYVNAKVVLVGDTGVGKTGLSLVLNHQPYRETDSTAGRHVWTFDSREVPVGLNVAQTRETLLWDLAGQPGYRVIHQLHLNEVAVALVVFDARSETDPLAGVRHWERALRLAQQRQGTSGVPMKKFLVSARNDRGGVSIGEERVKTILDEFGFDGYFKTSAKEGWQVKELRAAIEKAIEWETLPEVSSSQLFADIKSFLLEVKKTGRLLAPASQLYDDFARQHPDTAAKTANLRDQFETCTGRLENRDLIRRLTFGGYVLLQPELLDAYGSAMVNTAREEPDGLGSIAEEIALTGKFFVPKEQNIKDPGQEQLLLHATVEELVRHDLALRENADDGRYLVFPSQFNRDYEDAPEPKGKAAALTFEGPVQSLYATLAVRLGHSGLFTTGRAEMWRNAAIFTATAGGKCGLFLHEFAEARGRLILFFDDHASSETRFHFEEFVLAHARRRALDGTVELVRFFMCPDCADPVPDSYVKRLRDKGTMAFNCPCGGTVSLVEPKERIRFPSQVEAMDKSADRQRDFDAFVMSAKGETSTKDFHEWAGGERVTLAIVFTDVIGSTALSEEIREEAMNEVRRAHFVQSRKLLAQFKGREIKTIGDSFMAAFKAVDAALDYAIALQVSTGDPHVQIRAGIHIGPMQVEEGDVFGGIVNFAARVVGAIKGAEIWLSDRAKEDIDRLGASRHKRLGWKRHEGVTMKGFPGMFTLWSMQETG